jgi:hypothetical protein
MLLKFIYLLQFHSLEVEMQSHDLMRAFRWNNWSAALPFGVEEEIQFGLINLVTQKWQALLTVQWIDGNPTPNLHTTLDSWCDSVEFRGLAQRLKKLVKENEPPFRIILALASCGFLDITSYPPTREIDEIRKELANLEARCQELRVEFSSGYPRHGGPRKGVTLI